MTTTKNLSTKFPPLKGTIQRITRNFVWIIAAFKLGDAHMRMERHLFGKNADKLKVGMDVIGRFKAEEPLRAAPMETFASRSSLMPVKGHYQFKIEPIKFIGKIRKIEKDKVTVTLFDKKKGDILATFNHSQFGPDAKKIKVSDIFTYRYPVKGDAQLRLKPARVLTEKQIQAIERKVNKALPPGDY